MCNYIWAYILPLYLGQTADKIFILKHTDEKKRNVSGKSIVRSKGCVADSDSKDFWDVLKYWETSNFVLRYWRISASLAQPILAKSVDWRSMYLFTFMIKPSVDKMWFAMPHISKKSWTVWLLSSWTRWKTYHHQHLEALSLPRVLQQHLWISSSQ